MIASMASRPGTGLKQPFWYMRPRTSPSSEYRSDQVVGPSCYSNEFLFRKKKKNSQVVLTGARREGQGTKLGVQPRGQLLVGHLCAFQRKGATVTVRCGDSPR